jgi:histidinol-phosphate aminotransferase
MSQFWSPTVHSLEPYVPGEQPLVENLIKLNTNEHPLPPSPRVLKAVQEVAADKLRLYPDPNATALKQALGKRYGVSQDQVFVGNGSDEVLAHVFFALLKQSRPLLFPDLTYGFYPVYCRLYGISYREVPLDEYFRIRAQDYIAESADQKGGAIIFPNPNAPTGHALPLTDIERVLIANPDIPVVIDEAYVDFGAQSAVGLLDKYPNLLVVHTMSKSRSLAGLRVGYALGAPALIDGLERVKNSFNSYPLDVVAQAGALAAVEDDAYFEAACQTVVQTREALTKDLQSLGFEVLPSSANFVFARHPQHRGKDLAVWLRERAILVRHFEKPRIADFLRITVGTPAQCESLIKALMDCVRP